MEKLTPPVASGAKPLLGHALEFQKNRFTLLQRGYREHGPVFSLRLFKQNVAVLVGPDLQKTFYMETDKKLGIDKVYKSLRAMFGEVLFIAPHETYLQQRPFVVQAFRRQKMLHYIKVMQSETQKWLDSLADEGEMEITAEVGRLVQEVAGHALMGQDFQAKVGREFWELYLDVGKSLDQVLPPNLPLPKFRRRDKAKARMRDILQPIIAERRRHPQQYDDFLQDFVNAQYEDGRVIEDDLLLGLVMALMFAGHETTAGQAAWTVIMLLQHPTYQQQVQAEIATHLPYGHPLEPQVMAQLKHIGWAITEVERLYPSADLNMRTVEEDVTVGDYLIPKGWLVQTAAELAHKLPALWTAPEKFDPLRYAPGREEDKQHRFALIGFGGGVHKCTGMNFANNEMMVITALLYQQFDLELVTEETGIERSLGANRPTKTIVRYRRKPLDQLVSPTPAASAGCPHIAGAQVAPS